MDSLQDRLAELADKVPSGGPHPAELWSRGKRTHRRRIGALVAAVLVLVGTMGAGVGVGLSGDGQRRSGPAPATVPRDGFALPIEFPVGRELPQLGEAPGPLAAVWLAPTASGEASEAIGLVAESGVFGTLPIVAYYPAFADAGAALSPDGRRLAYQDSTGELVVRDLVSGDSYSSGPGLDIQPRYFWINSTMLVGRVVGERDRDGWVWQPDRALRLIDERTYEFPTSDEVWFGRPHVAGPGTRDWWVAVPGGGPASCTAPMMGNWGERFEIPELCDILGFLPFDVLLGHQNSEYPADSANQDAQSDGTVVALDHGQVQVVVVPGAPDRVAFARDLIAEALMPGDGRS